MKINKVHAVFFSPTGDTRRIVTYAAEKLAKALGAEYSEYSFTRPAARVEEHVYGEGELLVIGTPTYAGRVPNKILPCVQQKFSAQGALALPMVTFGGRAYESSLTELGQELKNNGFTVIGGAAVCAKHKMIPDVSLPRPDKEDYAVVDRLLEAVMEKLSSGAEPESVKVGRADEVAPYYTPLKADGEPAKFLKAKVKTKSDLCSRCGSCVSMCPMGVLSWDDPTKAEGTCIKCQACISNCPTGAKYFDDADLLSHMDYLRNHITYRAESEYFV